MAGIVFGLVVGVVVGYEIGLHRAFVRLGNAEKRARHRNIGHTWHPPGR